MVTIHVLNIEGKGNLPIHGDGKTSTLAAGYDVVAVDDPVVVGVVGREEQVGDTTVTMYKSIDYLEYHTAIKIAPQHRYYGDNVLEYYHTNLHPRSSVRKYNLVLANSVGVIDNDYRGEILVSFKYIFQPEDFVIQYEELEKGFKPLSLLAGINWTKVYRKGDKIGQLIAEKTNECNYVFVTDLSQTARGEGGHGSTGQKVFSVNENASPIASTLVDAYNKAGGVPIRKRYIDQIKEREYQTPPSPPSGVPLPSKTGITERK